MQVLVSDHRFMGRRIWCHYCFWQCLP